MDGDVLARNEAAIREAARLAMRSSGGGPRPVVTVVPGRLPAVVDAAELALIGAGGDIYQRGTLLVRPAMVPIKISGDRVVHAQSLVPLSVPAMVEAMTRAAEWRRWVVGEKEPRIIDCPVAVAKTYLARVGQWRLPVLAGIVNAPTLRADGSVLEEPGYDPATGLLFDPLGVEFPPVPARPSREDAERALGLLHELLAGFPFVGSADRSVALSAILTALVRRSLDGSPLHGFSAPAAGTGKSKLVDIASVIATGHEAAVMEEGDEDELPKRLGAALLAGDPVISIDNVERGALRGGFLCQALTQNLVSVRVLGQSENRRVVSNAFICATGNNLCLGGDMTRRAVLCTIDPKCERPELREFAVDPVECAKEMRTHYVCAALTILRAYHVAGRPGKLGAAGSFEDWSRLVRAALVWIGEEDAWKTTEAVRGSDPHLEALTAVVEQWRSIIGAEPVTVRQLIDRAAARHAGMFGSAEEFLHPDFREALLAVAGRGGAINGNRLGKWISRNRGRIVGGWKLERHGIIAGNVTWWLAPE